MKRVIFSNDFKFVEYRFKNYRYSDNRSGAPMHFLAVLEEGHCRIVSPEITLELEAGDAFYIPVGLSYQSYWEGPVIQFLSYGFQLFPDASKRRFLLQKLPGAAQSIRGIPLGEPDAAALGIFFRVLGEQAAGMQAQSVCRSARLTEQAIGYMRQNNALKISQVAQLCCVSESTLYAAFDKQLHKTPNQVRQQLLLEMAIGLLTTTDQSPTQISDSLGFSDVSYLRKLLKAYTGKTPLQLRKEARQV